MTKYKNYLGNEDDFQESTANFLDTLGVLWCHPPNGGKRNKGVAIKLKRQGVKPGVPDILIFEPRGIYHGFMIELKVGKNTTSKYQKEWLKQLGRRKFKVLVTYSLDELIAEVLEYLDL